MPPANKNVVTVPDPKFTVSPLSEAALLAQTNRPTLESEFCRPADCQRLFGLKRGVIYNLEKDGLIRAVSLRKRGQVRGTKLISVPSVRAYLNGLLAAQPAGGKD